MQSPSYTYCTINPNQQCKRTTSRAGDTRSGSRKTGASKLLCSMDSGDSFFWTSCTSLSSAAAAAASMRTMQYQIHLRKTLIGNRRRFIRLYRWVCQKYQFASRISRWFTVLQRPPTVCRVYYTVPDWLCTLMRTAIPKKTVSDMKTIIKILKLSHIFATVCFLNLLCLKITRIYWYFKSKKCIFMLNSLCSAAC